MTSLAIAPEAVTGYDELQRRLARGWNTWNFRSMIAHVLLPECFGLQFRLKEYKYGQILEEALVGRRGEYAEEVVVGPRDYRGEYTEVTVHWRDLSIRFETSATEDGFIALVTPMLSQPTPATLVVEANVLWGRPGYAQRVEDTLEFHGPERREMVYASGESRDEPYHGGSGPYLARRLDGPIVVSTGSPLTIQDASDQIAAARRRTLAKWEPLGNLAEVAQISNGCVAWNTVYEPTKRRVISPCGRFWCHTHGGYALYCWDTFFAAAMALRERPELAAANVVEMLRETTPDGFVPNYAYATGQRSLDRSQPPVGSWIVRDVYRATGWNWLLDETFEALLGWNRWWHRRRNWDGYLCWGSNPYEPTYGNMWETLGVGETYGAALESGMDNSPMYDDVPFDQERGLLALADVGLMSLYVADCQALAELACAMGRTEEAHELREREARYRRRVEDLWCEERGIYLNRRLDTGEFSPRRSPTMFYPMIAGIPTVEQARRMVSEHLLSPTGFWGEHVLPAISRDDPAFEDQDYWRGRVWAPLNYLVYLGLRQYPFDSARRDLVRKSTELMLKEWREEGHLHENYHCLTGDGDDRENSDPFHHFGGLMALMALDE